MDIEINEVQEIIKNLESGGELSIKEEKYLNVAKLCVQLAAENVALKLAIPEPRNVEFDNDSMDDVSLAEDVGFNDAIGQMKINISKTTSTNRIVAGIKADGVEEFAAKLRIPGDDQFFDALAKGVALAADDFAKQLREGADK